MDVSIVIPTKNGGHLFEKVLDAVFKQKTEYKYEYIPENDRYVINLYINDKGIVYDCKAGEGHAALIYKSEPEKGSIAAKLPAN